jgi:hypothetical protein
MRGLKLCILMAVFVALIGSVSAWEGHIFSTDSGGTTEINSFGIGDDVWVTGNGLYASASYKVYVCPPDMVTGDNLSEKCGNPDVTGLVDSITTDGSRAFTTNPLKIWAYADHKGEYDIVADYQGGGSVGILDGGDAIDYEFGVGFYVVPESVIAVALIALLVPGIIYLARKRK